ncbi:MAG: nucleotidyltransferase family protein [Candidatus Sericytochromatia bacterium]
MPINLPYPQSFPNENEELFLKMLLCNENEFINFWEQWNKEVIFDDIENSITRLLPLLYLRLKNFDISNEITGRIKGVYKLSWFKNQLLIEETKKVIDLFNKNNIPTILLKGVPLLLDVYKDRGVRILSDVDILIEPKNVLKAVNLLISNEWFYAEKNIIHIDEYINKETIDYLNVLSYETLFTNKKKVELDLHWSIFNLNRQWTIFKLLTLRKFKPIIFNDLHWKNCVEINVNGVYSNRLSNEDMLIHVIVHGAAKNPHRPLRWVIDSLYILNNLSINWDLFFKNVEICNYEVEVYIALNYLIEKFNLKLDDSIIYRIKDLKLNKKNIKNYYKTSNNIFSLFGNNIPYVWYRYWVFDRKKYIPLNLYDFINYLVKYFRFDSRKQLLKYFFNKYKKIFKNKI